MAKLQHPAGQAGEHVRSRGDGFGCPELRAQPAELGSQGALASEQSRGRMSWRGRAAMDDVLGTAAAVTAAILGGAHNARLADAIAGASTFARRSNSRQPAVVREFPIG